MRHSFYAIVAVLLASLPPQYTGGGSGSGCEPASNGINVRTGSGTCTARTVTAGTGTSVTNGDGVSGNPTVGADFSVVTQYTSGTATPSASCSPGELYHETDRDALWACNSTNTWTDTSTGGAPTDAQYVTLATNATLTVERVLTAGDWLESTDGGAGSTITLDFRPDPTDFIYWHDEFLGGRNQFNGELGGDNNWTEAGNGDTDFVVGEVDHRGIKDIDTTGTINSWTRAYIGNGNGGVGPFNAATFRLVYKFKLVQTSDTAVLIGMSDQVTARPPTGGIYLQYDSSANANFRCITRSSSSSTDTDTTIAADTGWHEIDIRGDGGSNITFYLDGTLRCTNSTNIPTTNMTFLYGIENLAASDKKMYMDSIHFIEELN